MVFCMNIFTFLFNEKKQGQAHPTIDRGCLPVLFPPMNYYYYYYYDGRAQCPRITQSRQRKIQTMPTKLQTNQPSRGPRKLINTHYNEAPDNGNMHFRSNRLDRYTPTDSALFYIFYHIFHNCFFHTLVKFTRNLISVCMFSKSNASFNYLKFSFPLEKL